MTINYYVSNIAESSSINIMILMGCFLTSKFIADFFKNKYFDFLPGVGLMLFAATIIYVGVKIGIYNLITLPLMIGANILFYCMQF